MKNQLKKTISFSAILLIFIIQFSQAQNQIFSQFLLNPYHFNPSYAAGNGYLEANIFFRKQWVGIENAPEALAFNVQAPVGRNVSLGINVLSNKTILLNYSGAMATFAYKVRISHNHSLNFGISAGIGLNNFDMDAVASSNDPALANVLQRSNYLTGQFGINYQIKNLNIGFALPSLMESKVNSPDSFQETNFNVFDNKFGSISYNINLRNIQLTPTVLYRALDNYQDQWEGMVMATYKNFIWVGASYRDGYGVTGFIGFRLKGNYRVGYAYEYPTSSIQKASQGSHEFFGGARLGKKNREAEIYAEQQKRDSIRLAKQELAQQEALAKEEETPPVIEQPVVVKNEIDSSKIITPQPKEAVVVETPEPEVVEPEVEENNIQPGFYLVVGAYQVPDNAMRNLTYLKNDGYSESDMIYIPEKDFFYVFLKYSTDRTEILEELRKTKSINKFFGAWIYTVK